MSPDSATVDLYLATRRLRAEIPMRGFTRLSDVLNNTAGRFLSGKLRGLTHTDQHAGELTMTAERDLTVRVDDVLFVQPIAATAQFASSPAEKRDRITQRMIIELGNFCLEGRLHLVDSVRWVDYATAMNDRFLAVTDASVWSTDDGPPIETKFVLVNGARLTALYEADR
jgi:hypothetical protein